MHAHHRHIARRLPFALLIWATLVSACMAHAGLMRSSPPDGAMLMQRPSGINLTFNEPVELLQATLLASGGNAMPLDGRGVDGRLVVGLPDDLSDGGYALTWRVVSEDGHPVSGTIAFTIGAQSAPATTLVETGTVDGSIGLVIARAVLFCALFFGVGISAFRVLAGTLPPSSTRLAGTLLGTGALAAIAVVGLQGLDMLGLGLEGLLHLTTWCRGLQSSYATTSALCLLSFGLAAAGLLRVPAPVFTTAALLAPVVAGVAISASGHAGAADPQWLTRTALVIHIAAIAAWVGALQPLFALLAVNDDATRVSLVRFSRAVPVPVALLFGSGIALATVQLGPPGAQWLSAYGIVLAAKLSLVGLVMGIACYNRWVLTAPAARGDVRAVRHLRRAIVVETMLIVLVLVLTSTWRFTTPPRAIDTAGVAQLSASTETFHAVMETTETRDGVAFDVRLTDCMGQPLAPRSITAIFIPAGDGPVPLEAPLHLMGGRWSTMTKLPIARLMTQWVVELRVRVDDFDQVTVSLRPE